MRPLLTIDFEASCLPRHGRSFPIEVAVADLAGWSRAWLIRPHADWAGCTWAAQAEALHGLSYETLCRDGLPAAQVAAELADVVAGRRVLADSMLDAAWLGTLCAAAGMPPAFAIDHIRDLADEVRASAADVTHAVDLADRRVPARHRAAPDALWLAAVAADLIAVPPRPLFDWSHEPRLQAA